MNKVNPRTTLGVLIVAAVAGLSSCSTTQPATAPSPEIVRNISVQAAQQSSVPDLLEAVGTVHAAQALSLIHI